MRKLKIMYPFLYNQIYQHKIMASLENKQKAPGVTVDKKGPELLKASDRKKAYEVAIKKMNDGQAEKDKQQRIENNKNAIQRFQRWCSASKDDDHQTQMNHLAIPTQNVDTSVIADIKKQATDLGYKIEDLPTAIKIRFV